MFCSPTVTKAVKELNEMTMKMHEMIDKVELNCNEQNTKQSKSMTILQTMVNDQKQKLELIINKLNMMDAKLQAEAKIVSEKRMLKETVKYIRLKHYQLCMKVQLVVTGAPQQILCSYYPPSSVGSTKCLNEGFLFIAGYVNRGDEPPSSILTMDEPWGVNFLTIYKLLKNGAKYNDLCNIHIENNIILMPKIKTWQWIVGNVTLYLFGNVLSDEQKYTLQKLPNWNAFAEEYTAKWTICAAESQTTWSLTPKDMILSTFDC